MDTSGGSWLAPADDAGTTGPSESPSGAKRRSFTTALLLSSLLVAGATVLVVGISRVAAKAPAHQSAADRLRSAQQHVRSIRADLISHVTAARELRIALRSQKTRIAYLRHAQVDGFAAAISAGSQRGATAGAAAGHRAGTRDALAQRTSASSQGWYYVRVSWRNGLPIVADSYTLDPGAEHAYWVEGGKAVNRDTSG
jgi:hypothetical protein